jgi:hypothetical protein
VLALDSKIIILPNPNIGSSTPNFVITKLATSSLLRTHFNGSVETYLAADTPLFKVAREGLIENSFQPEESGPIEAKSSRHTIQFLLDRVESSSSDPQWIVIAHPASLALRNTDHLLPPESNGTYAAEKCDFLWLKVKTANTYRASQGIWAVRASHLQTVLETWKLKWIEEQENLSDQEIWNQVIANLPLRKRCFESGEVVEPDIHAVDWSAISQAAFVTIPEWPAEEQRKFLQALYFGTFYGDETGLMVNILDP